MPTKKKRSTAPLTIAIRGRGVDIHATFDEPTVLSARFKAAITSIAEQMAKVGQTTDPDHDFDAVLRVIQHGELHVVRAIAKLVSQEIASRATGN